MITSKQFANIFGFDELVPRSEYVSVFHRDDLAVRELAHDEAPGKGRLFYEARVIWPDKSIHWVRVEGKVYCDAEGAAIRILGTLLDITEQKAAKGALAVSEQLLSSITSAAPACLWMSDEDDAVTYINQTWIDWTGKPYEEHLGMGWTNSIVAEDRKKTAEKFINDCAERRFYEAEYRIDHVDGTRRWCAANGRPHHGKDGIFAGYIGACVDITEQKHCSSKKMILLR